MKPRNALRCATLVVASALLFAANASATVITSPLGTTYTGVVEASSEGHLTLKGSNGLKMECNSTFKKSVQSHGASVTASFVVEDLTLTNCTNSYQVKILNFGTMEQHSLMGLTGTGQEITVITPMGFNCLYATKATQLGITTDTLETGGNATIHVNATLPRTGHSILCGSTGTLTGSYKITTPAAYYYD